MESILPWLSHFGISLYQVGAVVAVVMVVVQVVKSVFPTISGNFAKILTAAVCLLVSILTFYKLGVTPTVAGFVASLLGSFGGYGLVKRMGFTPPPKP